MSEKSKREKKTLSVREFADQVGLGLNAAYNAVHRREVPSIKLGSRILIPKAAVDRLLDAQ